MKEEIDLRGAPFLTEKTAGLYEPGGSEALGESAYRSTKQNRETAAAMPQWEAWREAAGRIKAYALANLDKLLAEFERNLIRERTRAGLEAARARGRKGGRPRKLDKRKVEIAYQLYDEKKYTIKEICHILGIAKPTLYAYLQRRAAHADRPQL